MQHCWVDIGQGHTTKASAGYIWSWIDPPCQAPNQRDELVEIPGTDKAYEGTRHDHAKPKDILEPFDTEIAFTAAREQAIFHNSYGREELKWYRE